MFKIDNIKNYIISSKQDDFIKITNAIYDLTTHLNETYPGYKKQFYEKQIKGCLTPNRNIIFIKDEQENIIAFSCLKKEKEEKKICTLYVSEKYRKHGLGTLLFEKSMKFLETTKPLITFTEDKLPMFKNLVVKYNWILTEIVNDMYNDGVKEFCFNGQLTNRDYRQELISILKKLKYKAELQLTENEKLEKIVVKK